MDASPEEHGLGRLRDEVCRWYDGFTFGGESHVYNPWSLTKPLESGALRAACQHLGQLAHLKGRAPRGHPPEHAFREQMAGGTIESIIVEQVIFPELSVRPGAVWALPLPACYPTSPGDAPGLPEEARTPKLTNREVGLTFDRMARSRFDAAEEDLGNLARALVSGDARGATRCLKDIMPYCMSSFDGAKRPAVREPERLNCGLVLGLPALTRDR